MLHATWGLLRSRAAGAAVAQLWQALGTLGLQVAAAWTLGAAGLGLVSLSLGVIVLATALASGMVGDALVVLDRSERRVRGALQAWALMLAGVSGPVAGVILALTVLRPAEAVLFAAALVAFQLEELVRRLFMATGDFWTLVVIDTVAVGATLAVVGVWYLTGPLSVGVFFTALAVGQLLGLVVGVALLPPAERVWAPLSGSDLRRVGGFGVWRGAQVAVPPLVLTCFRVLVVAFAGGAALGLVEAARIVIAPLLLVVQGLGSYLMSDYARAASLPIRDLRRRAARASLAMIGGVLAVGALLVAVTPSLGVLVTGPSFSVDPVTVAGWVLYVAGSASLQPFASLAVVRGRQRAVFACRVADAGVAAGLVALLLGSGLPAAWAPFALSAGLFLGGVLVRRLPLGPPLRHPTEASAISSSTSPVGGPHV